MQTPKKKIYAIQSFATLFTMHVIIFALLTCANSEQLKKENSKPNDNNTGYLKLIIIDSVNNGTFTKSTVSIRGIKELPTDIQPENDFKKKHDFILQGAIQDNTDIIIALEEGEYYTYLTVEDTIVRPLLVSDFSSKSIHFGYKSEFKRKGFFQLPDGFQLTKKDEPNCQDDITSGYIYLCKPLKIEAGKLTEIVLKFDKNSEFQAGMTAFFWIATILTPVPHLGAPLILAGTIIVNRNIEFRTNVKEKSPK